MSTKIDTDFDSQQGGVQLVLFSRHSHSVMEGGLFFSKIHHGLDTALHWRSELNHGGRRTALRALFDVRTASTASFYTPALHGVFLRFWALLVVMHSRHPSTGVLAAHISWD